MIEYKINVLEALKTKGFNTTRIRKEKLIPESTLTSLRASRPISWEMLDRICTLLDLPVCEIIEWKKTNPHEITKGF